MVFLINSDLDLSSNLMKLLTVLVNNCLARNKLLWISTLGILNILCGAKRTKDGKLAFLRLGSSEVFSILFFLKSMLLTIVREFVDSIDYSGRA